MARRARKKIGRGLFAKILLNNKLNSRSWKYGNMCLAGYTTLIIVNGNGTHLRYSGSLKDELWVVLEQVATNSICCKLINPGGRCRH